MSDSNNNNNNNAPTPEQIRFANIATGIFGYITFLCFGNVLYDAYKYS